MCRATFGAQREGFKFYVLACTTDEADSPVPITVTGTESPDARHLESFELRHLEHALSAARTAAASTDGILELDFGNLESEPEPHLFRRISGLLGGQRGLTMPKQPLALLIPKGVERKSSSGGNGWGGMHQGSHGNGKHSRGRSSETSSSGTDLWQMFMPHHVSSSSAFRERPEHSALLEELTLSAHSLLAQQPQRVLAHLLLQMNGNTFKRMQLAPYMLAVLQSNQYNASHQQPKQAAEHLLQAASQISAQTQESLKHVTPSELQNPLPDGDDDRHSWADLPAAMVNLSNALEKAQLGCGSINGITAESCNALQLHCQQLTWQRDAILEAHQQVITVQKSSENRAAGNLTWEVVTSLGKLRQLLTTLECQLCEIDAQLGATRQALASGQLGDRNGHNPLLHSMLTALDIEKAAPNKDIETWPHYARHAAAGMCPVHTILEVGYATHQSSNAYQVAASLARETEACSGMVGSVRSKQYPAGPRRNINIVAFRNLRLGGCSQLVPTPDDARAKCVEAVGSAIICCHNRSGFDELALIRDWLLAIAGLYSPEYAASSCSQSVQPLQAVFQAAKQVADQNTVPAFLGALDLCHSLHKELFKLLEEQQETSGVIKRAKDQGYQSVPASLERACEVKLLEKDAKTEMLHVVEMVSIFSVCIHAGQWCHKSCLSVQLQVCPMQSFMTLLRVGCHNECSCTGRSWSASCAYTPSQGG